MSAFKYQVSIADMEAFWDTELITTSRRAVMMPRLALAWAGAFLTYQLLGRRVQNQIVAVVASVLLAVVLFFISTRFMRALNRKLIGRRYRDSPDADLGPVTLRVAPDHFEVTGVTTQSQTTWSAVRKVVLTPAHAFIYLGPWKAVIVPLSQLETPQRSELLGLLRSHVPAGVVNGRGHG